MPSVRWSIRTRRCTGSTPPPRACRPPAKIPPPLLCDAAVGVGVVVLQRQGTERHVAGNAGAAADPGIELDAAAVQLDEALHQREAEAGAAVPRLQRAALEIAEHPVAVVLGSAAGREKVGQYGMH